MMPWSRSLDLLPEDLGMDKEKFIEIFDELKDFLNEKPF